jgi:hypothetical protein
MKYLFLISFAMILTTASNACTLTCLSGPEDGYYWVDLQPGQCPNEEETCSAPENGYLCQKSEEGTTKEGQCMPWRILPSAALH